MSQVYRASHRRSYRPVRVLAREVRQPDLDVIGKTYLHAGPAVVLTLAALAILDGALFLLIGLR